MSSRRKIFGTGGGSMTREIAQARDRRAGESWRDRQVTPRMVELPSGQFTMGENACDRFADGTERPAHAVFIPPGVSLGCFAVTVGEFRHFRPGYAPDEPEEWPVARVTWLDACA